jgi:general stress protein 26
LDLSTGLCYGDLLPRTDERDLADLALDDANAQGVSVNTVQVHDRQKSTSIWRNGGDRSDGNMTQPARFIGVVLTIVLAAGTARAQDPAKPPPTRDAILTAARAVIGQAGFATFVTLDSTGAPQARVVDPFSPEDDFVVWIGTNGVTRKVAQIQADPRVTLMYFDQASFSYVSLLGTARIVRDPAEKAKRWKDAWARMYKDKNRGDDYTLICVTPSRLEILSPAHGLMPDRVTGRPVMLNLR